MDADVKLTRFDPYVRLGEQYIQRPRYLVYAGLVFQPMDRNLIDAYQIRDPSASYLFDNFLTDKLYVGRPEPVILTTVLADDVNTYLTPYAQSVVDEVNGVKIKSMKDLKEALAKRDEKSPFVVIKLLEKNRPLVLRRSPRRAPRSSCRSDAPRTPASRALAPASRRGRGCGRRIRR